MELSPPRSSWKRRLGKFALGLGLMLIPALYCGISLYSAHELTRAHNRPIHWTPEQISVDALPWTTRTEDGLTLRGWYCPTPERHHLLVLVHGLWGNRDEMAGQARDLHKLGYDVILFDLRGHGLSDPSRVTMGRRERNDLRAVLAWAKLEGFAPDQIGWLGNSMGASTLLMEAARNPSITAAVIDSPYGSLPELLNTQLSEHSGLPKIFNPGILLAARHVFGVRTDDLIPINAANSWGDRPLLLIHGEADSIVPVRQARRIATAAGKNCRAVTLPGVEHVAAYRAYPANYVAAVDRFFLTNLRPYSGDLP